MEQKKTTLVLGASDNPGRYSHMAIERLRAKNIPVKAVGRKAAQALDIPIETEIGDWTDIHTITLYLSAENQKPYYEKILSLQPQRIIFNPGAENEELETLSNAKGIETIEACTLVMLGSGMY